MKEFCGGLTVWPCPFKPEIKDVVPDIQKGLDVGQSRRSELDPEVNDCRSCKKNSSILSCIDKRTKEVCDQTAKMGQFTADKAGKGLVPLRKL